MKGVTGSVDEVRVGGRRKSVKMERRMIKGRGEKTGKALCGFTTKVVHLVPPSHPPYSTLHRLSVQLYVIK